MDLRQLRYFLTIAEEEQITGAAKKLNIAQPPLSQQLKLLEEELGVKLMERGSRKIKLTEAGKLLRNRAEQILELNNAAIKELKDLNSDLSGTLSIGTVSSSGASLLPKRIHNFNKKYHGIDFEIWEGNTYRILEILNSGVIEIGIVRTPFNTDNLECIFMQNEPMAAVYTEDSLFSEASESVLLNSLRDKPIIIYRRFQNIILEACYSSGFYPHIICKADDARTALLWANSGIGTAIVPKSAVKLVGSPNLKYKTIIESSLETQIAAISVKGRYLSSAALHFLESFKE